MVIIKEKGTGANNLLKESFSTMKVAELSASDLKETYRYTDGRKCRLFHFGRGTGSVFEINTLNKNWELSLSQNKYLAASLGSTGQATSVLLNLDLVAKIMRYENYENTLNRQRTEIFFRDKSFCIIEHILA